MRKPPPQLWSYLAVVLVAVLSVWLIQRQAEREDEGDRIEACEVRNDFRVLIGQLIDAATQPAGATGLDLTGLPSYADLPSTMQAYLAELQAALATPGGGPPPGLSEFAEEALVPEVCT